MAARLGLDTSDFVEKMKGVEGFSSASGQRIAAEMKRTTREGAEGFRVFDEMIGLHLNRPLTRLIVETFPALGEAFQSALGGLATSAVVFASVEVIERVAESVQKAQKKLQDAQDSAQKVKATFADTMEYFSKELRDQSLSGTQKKLFDVDFAQVDVARQKIALLIDELDKAAKAGEAASGWWTKWLAALGTAAHEATTSGARLGVEAIDAQYASLKDKYEELAKTDALKATHEGADLLKKSLADAESKLDRMKSEHAAMQNTRPALGLGRQQIIGSEVIGAASGSTPAEIQAQTKFIDDLKHLIDVSDQAEKSRKGARAGVFSQDAAAQAEKEAEAIRKIEEAAKRERQEMDQLTKSIQEAFGKDDLVARFNVELNAQLTALNQLQAMAGAKGFQERIGMSPDAARDFLIQANILRESEAQLKSFLESNETNKRPGSATSFPFAGASTATPVLGAGSATDGQFAAFQENKRAQMEAIKKIFEDALTPQQRFIEKQRELDLVMKDSSGNFIAGERGALAYKQALKELTEQEIQTLNATGKVSDAIRAWGLEAQQKNIGKEIVSGMQSAESAVASSLTVMIEHHRNATEQLRQLWEGFFQSLAQKAITSGLDKLLGSIIGAIGFGAKGGASSGAAAATSGPVPGFVGWFADGGDVTPGQSFISGEAGTEEIRLTAGGGAHVTPLGSGSGGSSAYYDMRGSVVSEDLMKRAEAHRLISLSEQRMMQAIPSMQREIGLRKRPG